MNIYLDIETIPAQLPGVKEDLAAQIAPPGNYKKADTIAEWERMQKPALIEEAWLKTSFDGAYGQVVCAAVAIDDDEPVCFYQEDWGNSERYILSKLFERIAAAGDASPRLPCFIGHYITGFDLRFLFQRAVVHGIKPPAVIPFQAKPWDPSVFDTMTAWAGPKDRVSLEKLCKVFGLPGKGEEIGDEIDGSKVWEFVQAGRIADVAKYCSGDVERVRELHRRMTFAKAA